MVKKKKVLCNTRSEYIRERIHRTAAIIVSFLVFLSALFMFGLSSNELTNLIVNMVSDQDAREAWFWGIMSILAACGVVRIFCHLIHLLNSQVIFGKETPRSTFPI